MGKNVGGWSTGNEFQGGWSTNFTSIYIHEIAFKCCAHFIHKNIKGVPTDTKKKMFILKDKIILWILGI